MRISRDTKAQAVLIAWLTRKGLKKADFGKALGMAMQAGYNRYNDPSRLTVEDLRNMKLSLSEIAEIVGLKYMEEP